MGALRPFFCWDGSRLPIHVLEVTPMSKNIKFLVHGGVLAALYVVLTYAQNLLWPGSTTMAIQMPV